MPDYRASLADGLSRLARLKRDAGDAAGAAADARRAVALLEGLSARDGRQSFGLACARATLAAAGGRDGSGPSAAEAPLLADRAMDDLRRAAAKGYRNAALYRYEPALAPLRGREDFRLLLLDLAFPADPFAAARSGTPGRRPRSLRDPPRKAPSFRTHRGHREANQSRSRVVSAPRPDHEPHEPASQSGGNVASVTIDAGVTPRIDAGGYQSAWLLVDLLSQADPTAHRRP